MGHFKLPALALACAIAISAVAAPPRSARSRPSPAFAAATAAVAARCAELDKAKTPFMQCVAKMEELRATEPYATNAALRAEVTGRMLSYTLLPGWTSLRRYDREACTAKAFEICRETLAFDDFTAQDKERYAQTLAALLAGEKDFEGAEKVAREQIARVAALENPDAAAAARAWLILADVFRWQDRADDMVAAIEKARDFDKFESTKTGSDKARALGGLKDKIDAWWRDLAAPYAEALYFAEKEPSRCRKAALDYVLCETNRLGNRLALVTGYFMADNEPDSRAARASLGKCDLSKEGSWKQSRPVLSAFQHGDYALVAAIMDDIAATAVPKALNTPSFHRIWIISLGATGRKAEAAALAKAHETDTDNTPLDTLRYQVYAAILEGRDALPVITSSPCERKDKIAATLSAARQCQVWEMTDEAERYANAYLSYSTPPPKRVAKVAWSDKPVNYVSVWRELLPSLESHVFDLPFDASLDFLETDVGTGREKVEFEKGAKALRMSFTTVADRNALHLFFRVEDPEARLVETGFKGGVKTEMYLAPGADQPYTCFGTNPRDGLTFAFQTSYTSADHKRMDLNAKSGPRIRHETDFTDDDYVLHVSFPWDDFYQKLPSPKAEWKFDAITWCPDGGFTWGGSIGIHNASRWGTLVLDFAPAQLTEIRRGILLRTANGGWRACKYPGSTLDYFDKWADKEIGDPGFYAACLAPLKDELAGYAARIKPGMADADVNEIYEKGLVRMKGLKYEIDRLRREYFARKLTE